MCGFSGIIELDNKPNNTHFIKEMTNAILHRGPDSQGFVHFSLNSEKINTADPSSFNFTEEFSSSIGFNRLSIQDLTDAGNQPMISECKKVFIVFNGEIYNAPYLRNLLKEKNVYFKSKSDTEVILQCYLNLGLEKTLKIIEGMFSISICDLRNNNLFLIRDRFGIKPFYYYINNKTLLFSSEVKSFLSHPNFNKVLKEDSLNEYVAFRYLSNNSHLLESVKQIKPGFFLKITPDEIFEKNYYDLVSNINPIEKNKNQAEIIEENLKEKINSHLLSDAPIGFQLSGGIDSSLITLLANKENKDINAYTISFEDSVYDESKWAKEISKKCGIKYSQFMLKEDFVLEALDDCTWHLDQPLNHPNSIGLYLLGKRCPKEIKVLLSGEGADEIFGGYPRFYYSNLLEEKNYAKNIFNYLPKPEIINNFYRKEIKNNQQFNISLSMYPSFTDLYKILPSFKWENAISKRLDLYPPNSPNFFLNHRIYEINTFLPDLLIRQDKMFMASSIETRVPFLDHHFVEYILSINKDYLIDSNILNFKNKTKSTKKILKEICAKYTSKKFAYRSKSGFSLPLRNYFSSKKFRKAIEEKYLESLIQRDIFSKKFIIYLWNNINNLNNRSIELMWIILSFEIWCQKFEI